LVKLHIPELEETRMTISRTNVMLQGYVIGAGVIATNVPASWPSPKRQSFAGRCSGCH
jgi:hypothetical protein